MLLVFSKAVQMWKKLAMNIHSNYVTSLNAAIVKTFSCLLSITLPFMSFTDHIKTTKTKVQEQESHRYHDKEVSGQNFICVLNNVIPA